MDDAARELYLQIARLPAAGDPAVAWSHVSGAAVVTLAGRDMPGATIEGITVTGPARTPRTDVEAAWDGPTRRGRLVFGDGEVYARQYPDTSSVAPLAAAAADLCQRLDRPDGRAAVLTLLGDRLAWQIFNEIDRRQPSHDVLDTLAVGLVSVRLLESGSDSAADTLVAMADDWSGSLRDLLACVHVIGGPPSADVTG